MNVVVQPGAVYAQAALDATAYSSLPADSFVTQKQGILKTAQTLATPAPTTSGQSIVYLISGAFLEADTNAVVLPYYNASNPSQAFSGPNGTGASQNTTRQDTVQLTLTAGVPATTGSQLTPATPAGQIALYTITVAYGATSVVAGNIAKVSGAPFLGSNLLSMIEMNGTYSVATGTANAHVIAPTPPVASRIDGMVLKYKAPAANTGALTVNDGLGAVAVVGAAHSALQGGEVAANGDVWLQWNSSLSSYVMLDSTGGSVQVAAATQTGHAVNLGQFGASLAGSGYQKLPNGWILQWGQFVGSASADTPVTFPIAFPTAFRLAVVSGLCSGTGAWGGYNSATVNGMNCNWWSAASTRQSGSGTYIAIGS